MRGKFVLRQAVKQAALIVPPFRRLFEQRDAALRELANLRARFNGHADQTFGHLTYAQHGEDLIVVNIFEGLSIPSPSYIDIGAHHPINISNTALLYARGSRGINIEANPILIKNFYEMRPEDKNINVGIGPMPGFLDFYQIDDWSGRNTFVKRKAEAFTKSHPQFKIQRVDKIQVRTLDDVIATEADGKWPDFMSIDVEGWDYLILQSSAINSGNGPKVICVELTYGGTDDRSESLRELLMQRGYVALIRTIKNAIYVEKNTAVRLKA